MKKVSKEIENLAVQKLKSGLSLREIGRELNISYCLVYKIKKRNDIEEKCNKNGRKKIFTTRDQRTISRLIMTNKAKSAHDVKKQLNNAQGTVVSTRTVQRELKRIGFKVKKKIKKPLLTPKHRKQRLEFAKKYENWTFAEWSKVIWTDESKINLIGSDGIRYVWKKAGEGISDRDFIPTVKYGGGKLLFWGCFSSSGVGKIVKIDGIMDAKHYIDILNNGYLPSLRGWRKQIRSTLFMQDNDPKHKAKITLEFLNSKKFKILEWPAQSPDLNPIENLWSIVKNRVYNYETRAASRQELWERVEYVWSSITVEECKKLIGSMPARIAAVIRSRGGYTKY